MRRRGSAGVSPLETLGLAVFILVLFAGVYTIIYGIPGTIIIFINVLVFSVATGFSVIELKHLFYIALIVLSVETADALIGLSNTKRPALSAAGIVASAAGAIIGAIVLTPLLLGLGTLLGIFFGGLAGLFVMQRVEQQKLKPAFREPTKAMLVRIATICGKGAAAMGVTVFMLSRLYS